jgi:hypothetical protein
MQPVAKLLQEPVAAMEPVAMMEPVAKLLQKFVVAMEPVTKLLQPAPASLVILQEPFVGVVLAALLSL